MCEVRSLYQARQTLLELLSDRGHTIPENMTSIGLSDFREQYSFMTRVNRSKLGVLAYHPDDGAILVFFRAEDSIGIEVINDIDSELNARDIRRAIIIIPGVITPSARKRILELSQCGSGLAKEIEIFTESELLCNPTRNINVPQHRRLSVEEVESLKKCLNLKDISILPKISSNDPIARYYKFKKGNLIEIKKRSETTGQAVCYRFVQ